MGRRRASCGTDAAGAASPSMVQLRPSQKNATDWFKQTNITDISRLVATDQHSVIYWNPKGENWHYELRQQEPERNDKIMNINTISVLGLMAAMMSGIVETADSIA